MKDFFNFWSNKTPIDMEHEIFFGKYNKYTDFMPNKVHGIEMYGRKESRINMARLYMYMKGYSLDEILDNKKLISEKKKIGKEFYNLITKGNMDEIAIVYSKMISKISKEKIPDLLRSERNFNEEYKKFIFIVHTFKDLSKLVELQNNNADAQKIKRLINENIANSCIGDFNRARKRIEQADKYGVAENYDIITDDEYIKANKNREKDIEENIKKRKEKINKYREQYNFYMDVTLSYEKIKKAYEEKENFERDITEKEKKKKIENDLFLKEIMIKNAISDMETAADLVEMILRIMSYGFAEGIIFDKVWEMNLQLNEKEKRLEDNLKEIKIAVEPLLAYDWEKYVIKLKDVKSSNLGKENNKKNLAKELINELNFCEVTPIIEVERKSNVVKKVKKMK